MANTQTIPRPAWTLGDRLRKARECAGIGSGQMARTLHVSRNSITNYERRETVEDVSYPVLIAWSSVTGVPLDWLLGTTDSDEGGSTLSTWTPLMARQAA
jgi:transcriptional regulator with XRE-family HTH domain